MICDLKIWLKLIFEKKWGKITMVQWTGLMKGHSKHGHLFTPFFKNMCFSKENCVEKLYFQKKTHIREFQQGFTTDLPTIYQWFTKDLPKIRKYLAFYFLNIYQGFTTDLPQIYQRFTKDLPSLPNTYQQLTKIFFQFTKDLPQIYQHIFGVKYFLIFRK